MYINYLFLFLLLAWGDTNQNYNCDSPQDLQQTWNNFSNKQNFNELPEHTFTPKIFTLEIVKYNRSIYIPIAESEKWGFELHNIFITFFLPRSFIFILLIDNIYESLDRSFLIKSYIGESSSSNRSLRL
jgi:hypothetical protein